MNSAAESKGGSGLRCALLCLGAAGMFALLSSGCADHGPTNLYSNPLFGQTQAGATMQLWRAEEFSLSTTAGVGPDQYVLKIKNTGSGAVLGPITATLTLSNPCSGTQMESYAGVVTSTQTVVFGATGEAITSGEELTGYATNPPMSGYYAYSAQVTFTASCADAATDFNVSLTDGKGDTWTGTFSGTNL